MCKPSFLLLLSALLSICSLESSAQVYKTAAGLRLGYPVSVSIKHFLSESSALEAYVGTRGYGTYRWTNISGAYLVHKPLEGVDGLQYYFGGGASLYFWTFDFVGDYNTRTFGIQGYAGLDYTFEEAPISLTLDWIPTFFINGYLSGFGGGYGSLGARYVFAR